MNFRLISILTLLTVFFSIMCHSSTPFCILCQSTILDGFKTFWKYWFYFMAEVLQLGFYNIFFMSRLDVWRLGKRTTEVPLSPYIEHASYYMHAMTSHCPVDHPVDMVSVKFILYLINFFPNFTQWICDLFEIKYNHNFTDSYT